MASLENSLGLGFVELAVLEFIPGSFFVSADHKYYYLYPLT
jgi:hypothetical protein